MSGPGNKNSCLQAERVVICAHGLLPPDESAAFRAHVAGCADCQQQLDQLRPLVDLVIEGEPVGRDSPGAMRERLAQFISKDEGRPILLPATRDIKEPDWELVAPGISVKILARDSERERVSMLVRLAPGVDYPPHSHAGVEELHLLDGELWIDDRKLFPGDYNRAEPGTADKRVWSETGCTCVLITSPADVLASQAAITSCS